MLSVGIQCEQLILYIEEIFQIRFVHFMFSLHNLFGVEKGKRL